MTLLPGPYEIHELADLEHRQLTVIGFTVGEVVIHPRYAGAPAEKTVRAMRLVVPATEKTTGMAYWDITSQTLVAQLEPILKAAAGAPVRIKLTAHGVAPTKRYAVEIIP